MQNLQGKTAFVTGGASGIGLGISKALLGAGMNVVVADIRDDHLDAAKLELGSAERVLALKLDVTSRADYARAATALRCEVACVKAVTEVEAGKSGFFPSGRPKILFEAHHFARLNLKAEFVYCHELAV